MLLTSFTNQRESSLSGLVDVLVEDQPSIPFRDLILCSATNLRQGIRQVDDVSAVRYH